MYEGKCSTQSGRLGQYSFTDYEEEFELNPISLRSPPIPRRSPPIPKLKYMVQSAPGTPLIGNLSSNHSYNRNHHNRQIASLRKNFHPTSQSVFDFNATPESHLRSDFSSYKKKSEATYTQPSTNMSYTSSSNRNHLSPEFLNSSLSKVSSPNRLPPSKQAMQLQQRLQFCRDWINNKDTEIASESYSKNPSTVLEALNKHMSIHQSIRQFHQNVFECGKLRKQLNDNERESFKQQVSQVELNFKQLHSNSSFRLANLKSLMKFLECCSKELDWLKSNEVQLSDYITSFESLEFELQNLKTSQEDLKNHSNAIHKLMQTAANLSNDNHPANTIIQLSANLLKGQWDRLNTLINCINLQIMNIQKFAEFMREAREVKEWTRKESALLSQLEGRAADPKVQQSLQSVQGLIQERFQVLNELIIKYKSTPPLKLKNQPFPPNSRVQAISSYRLSEANIEEGNICVLVSDSLGKQWRVRSNDGVAMYPSCLFIVLPSYQAVSHQAKSSANSVEGIVEQLRQNLISLHSKVLGLGEEKMELSGQNFVGHGRRVSDDEEQRFKEHYNSLKTALRECAKKLNVQKFQNIPTNLKECKSFDARLKETARELIYMKENCLDLQEKLTREASKREHVNELLNELESIQNACSQMNERQEILKNLFASTKDLEEILSSNSAVNNQRFHAQLKTHESLLNSLQVTLHALYGDVPLASQYLQLSHGVLEGFKKKAKEPVNNTEKASTENTVSSAFVQAPQTEKNSDFSMVSARTLRNQLEQGASQNRELRKYKGVYDGPIDEPMEEHMQSEDVEEMLQPLKDGEEKISKHTKQEFHSRKTNLGFESISKHEKNLTSLTSTKTTEFTGHFEFPISIEKAEKFGLLNTVNGLFTHPVSSETISLKDAVMGNYIKTDSITFLCPTNNRVFSLKDAFKNKILTENGYFDSLEGSVCFKDLLDQNYIKISSDKKDTIEKVEIDNRSEDSLSINSIDSGKVYAVVSVIDPISKRSIDAFKAVQIGVLDQANATYNVHDPTGQLMQIPIVDAIDLGFVMIDENFVQSEHEEGKLIHETKTYDIIGMIDPINKKEISLNDAIKNNYIDQKKGTFYNVVSRKTMPIIEAIGLGHVIAKLISSEENADPYTKNKIMMQKEVSCVVKSIVNPQTGEQISIHEAIKKGIFNPTKGEYTDLKSHKVLTLNEAIDMGYVLLEEGKLEVEEIPREEKVSSLHIDDEMDAREEMAREEITEETRTFQITGIKDVKNDEFLNFADAIYTGLIDEEKGLYFNNLTGQVLTVPEALQKGFVVGCLQSVDHQELFRSDVVARKKDEILSVFNPITRQEVSAHEALQLGLISKDFKRYFNPAKNQYITFDEALKKYLIKLKDTQRMKKSSTDETDLENDKISTETPVSIDWSGGIVLHKITKNVIPINEALKYGLIEESVAAVLKLKHPEEFEEEKVEEKKIDDSFSLKMVIQMKLLRDSSGRIIIKDQSYLDQKNKNLHKKLKSSYGLSFYNALRLGLYSMQRGLYYDPHTKQKFSIFEAISAGLLNTKLPALVDITNGKVISLKDLIAEDYVDPKTGKIMVSKLSSSQFTLDPIYSGVHSPNMNLEDAIRCNLLNDETGLFTIPFVEKHIDLKTAIDMGYIASKSSIVLNPVNGDKMFLEQALKDDIIDNKSGKFVDATAGNNISLSKAIIVGLIKHSYLDDCSFIMDCESGEVFSIENALDKKILDFDYPTVYDVLLKKRVPFKIALSSGLIDKLKKRYINKLDGNEISLSKALKLGLILLPGCPVLSKPKKTSKDVVQTQFQTNVQLVKGAKLQEKITETFGSAQLPPLELHNKDKKNFKLLSNNPIIVNASKEQDNKKFIESKFYDTVTDDIPFQTTISNDGSLLTTKETVTKVNKAQIKETVENFDNFNNNFNYKKIQNARPAQGLHDRSIQNNRQNSYNLTLKETAEPLEVEELQPKVEASNKQYYLQNQNFYKTQNQFNNDNSYNLNGVIEPITVEEIRARVGSSSSSVLSPSQNVCRTIHPTYNSFNYSEQKNNFVENSALERGLIKINWETGNIMNISNKTLMNSKEAYEKGFIDLHIKDLIDNRGLNTSINPLNKITLNEALKYKMIIIPINKIRDPSTNENITLSKAIDRDLIDINRSVMIDPATHKHTPVKSLIEDGIFDVDNFVLKNKENGKTLALEEIIFQAFLPEKGLPLATEQFSQTEAIERGLLNPNTNEFIEPTSKIIVSEKLAKEIGYIKEPFKSTTLINALKSELLSHNTFVFTHPTTKENLNLEEALLKGYIIVPNREEICEDIDGITLQAAFSRGYIDIEKSIFTDPITDAEIPFDTAIKKGWITLPIDENASQLTRFLEFEDLPLNFGDAVLSGLYDENISLFINPYTGKHITLEEALKCNIVKSTSFVKSPATEQPYTVKNAINSGFLDFSSGRLIDLSVNKSLEIDEALYKNLILSSGPCVWIGIPFIDYLKTSGKVSVFDQLNEKYVSLQKALDLKLIDLNRDFYLNNKTGTRFSLKEAAQRRFVLVEKYKIQKDEMVDFKIIKALDTAINNWITPSNALRAGILNMDEKLYYDTKENAYCSLLEALNNGKILVESLDENRTVNSGFYSIKKVFDVLDNSWLSPYESEKKGLIDMQYETYFNNLKKDKISFVNALKMGFIQVEEVNGIDKIEREAIKANDVSEVFDYTTGERFTLVEAIENNFVDKTGCYFVDPTTKNHVTLYEAWQKGYIKLKNDENFLLKSKVITSVLDPRTGEEIPISDAVKHQIVNKSNWSYWNMKTNTYMDLDFAISKGLVLVDSADNANMNTSRIKIGDSLESKAKVYVINAVRIPGSDEVLDPVEAERRGYINKIQGTYMYPITGERISIKDAISKNYVVASLVEDPDYDALKKNEAAYAVLESDKLLSEISSVVDLRNGEKVSVFEGIRRGLVDLKDKEYINKATGEKIPIDEAFQMKLVLGSVSDENRSLKNRKIYFFKIPVLNDSSTNQKQEVNKEYIGLQKSVNRAGCLSLKDATSQGLIDHKNNIYYDPVSGEDFPLDEALQKGFLYVDNFSNDDFKHYGTSITFAKSSKIEELPNIPENFNDDVNTELEFVPSIEPFVQNVDTIRQNYDFKPPKVQIESQEDTKAIKTDSLDRLLVDLEQETRTKKFSGIKIDSGIYSQPIKPKFVFPSDFNSSTSSQFQEKIDNNQDLDLSPVSFINESQQADMSFSEGQAFDNFLLSSNQNSDNIHSSPTTRQNIALVMENDIDKTNLNDQNSFENTTYQDWTDILSEKVEENKLMINENSFEGNRKNSIISYDKTDASTITTRGSWGEHAFTMDQLLEYDYYDKNSGMVLSQNKDYSVSLLEAIEKGWVCKDSVELYDATSSKIIKLLDASSKGIIDLDNGNIIDSEKNVLLSFKDSINRALDLKLHDEVFSSDSVPIASMTLCEAMKNNLFSLESKLFEFSDKNKFSLKKALEKNFLNSSSTMVKDPSTGQRVPFDLLVSLGLIDLENAVIKDSEGKKIPLNIAYSKNIIFTSDSIQKPVSLMKLFEDGYYHPEMNMFFDMESKKYIKLGEAIDKKILDSKSVLFYGLNSNEVLGLNDAFKSGLIDRNTGLTKNGLKLIDAYETNQIIIKPITVIKAIELNLLNETTGKFLDPSFRKFFTLEQCLKEGLLDPQSTIINPSTNKPILLLQAIQEGIIDGKTGTVVNTSTEETLTLKEVYNASKFIKKNQLKNLETETSSNETTQVENVTNEEINFEKNSLTKESDLKLIYKPSSNTFVDPITEKNLTLEEAIIDKYINPKQCLLLVPNEKCLIPLQKFIDDGLVDLKKGKVYSKAQNIDYLFSDLLHNKSILKIVQDNYSLAEAIDLDLFNLDTGVFFDPNTEEKISLKSAFEKKLISPVKSLLILEKESLNLLEATKRGLMDEKTADILLNNKKMSYIEALQNGIILDSYVPLKLSFEEALKANLFDKKTKCLIHPILKKNITLFEALESEILESDKCFLYLPDSQIQISLSEAANQNLLSKDLVSVKDPKKNKEFNVIIQLMQALHNPTKKTSVSDNQETKLTREKPESVSHAGKLEGFDLQEIGPLNNRQLDILREKLNLYKEWIGKVDDQICTYVVSDDEQHNAKQIKLIQDFLKTINDVKNGLSVVHNSVDNISKGSQPTSPTSQLDQSSLEKLLIVNMEIKQEFANLSKGCEAKLKSLSSCQDELAKFFNERTKFEVWLKKAEEVFEQNLNVLDHISGVYGQKEALKTFVDDVMIRHGDLRYVEICRSQFLDQAKHFQVLQMENKRMKRISSQLDLVNSTMEFYAELKEQYLELRKKSVNRLDLLEATGDCFKRYNDLDNKITLWLDAAEVLIESQEKISNDGVNKISANDLKKVSGLQTEVIAQVRYLNKLESSSSDLVEWMNKLNFNKAITQPFLQTISDLKIRLNTIEMSLRKCLEQNSVVESANNSLDRANIDELSSWVGSVEKQLNQITEKKVNMKKATIMDQLQEIKKLESEIHSQAPNLCHVAKDSEDQVSALKLEELEKKYASMSDKVKLKEHELEKIIKVLGEFQEMVKKLKKWMNGALDSLDGKQGTLKLQETQKLYLEVFQKKDEFHESYRKFEASIKGFDTAGKEWVSETFQEMEISLNELEELCKNKTEEENRFSSLKEKFDFLKNKLIDWILENEELLEYLNSELNANAEESLLNEIQEKVDSVLALHQDERPTLEELNETGCLIDAKLTDPDHTTTLKRRLKRHLKKGLRSTSPLPVARTDDSELTSEYQRILKEINERFEYLEFNLNSLKESTKSRGLQFEAFHKKCENLLKWLNDTTAIFKRKQLHSDNIDELEEESQKTDELKKDLIKKEIELNNLRKEHETLYSKTNKQHEGLEKMNTLWDLICKLSTEWNMSLKQVVNEEKNFKALYKHLQTWLQQKSKMVEACSAKFSSDPAVLEKQNLQVELLADEMKVEKKNYEKFIETGVKILERCEANSNEAFEVNNSLQENSHNWERLEENLKTQKLLLEKLKKQLTEFRELGEKLERFDRECNSNFNKLSQPSVSTDAKHKKIEEIAIRASEELKTFNNFVNAYLDLMSQINDVKMTDELTTHRNKIENVYTDLLSTIEKEKKAFIKEEEEKMKEVDEICGASERLSYLGKGLENISQLPTNTVYILKTEQPIQKLKNKISKEISNVDFKNKEVSLEKEQNLKAFDEKAFLVQTQILKLEEQFSPAVNVSNVFISKLDLLKRWINEKKTIKEPIEDKNDLERKLETIKRKGSEIESKCGETSALRTTFEELRQVTGGTGEESLEIEDLSEKILSYKNENVKELNELVLLQSNLIEFEQVKAHLKGLIDEVQNANETEAVSKMKLDNLKEDMLKLKSCFNSIENDELASRKLIVNIKTEIRSIEDACEQAKGLVIQKKQKVEAMKNKADFLQKKLNNLEDTIVSQKESFQKFLKETNTRGIEDSLKEIELLLKNDAEISEQIHEAKQILLQNKSNMQFDEKAFEKLNELEENNRNFQQTIEKIYKDINKKKAEQNKLINDLTSQSTQLEDVETKLADEMQVSSINPALLEKNLKEIQKIESGLNQQRSELNNLNTNHGLAHSKNELVSNKFSENDIKLVKLSSTLTNKRKKIKELMNVLKLFDDKFNTINGDFQKLEKDLERSKNKNSKEDYRTKISTYQNLVEKLEDEENSLAVISSLKDSICSVVATSFKNTGLVEEIKANSTFLKKRFDGIMKELSLSLNEIEPENVESFSNDKQEVADDNQNLTVCQTMKNQKDVNTDVLKENFSKIEKFPSKLSSARSLGVNKVGSKQHTEDHYEKSYEDILENDDLITNETLSDQVLETSMIDAYHVEETQDDHLKEGKDVEESCIFSEMKTEFDKEMEDKDLKEHNKLKELRESIDETKKYLRSVEDFLETLDFSSFSSSNHVTELIIQFKNLIKDLEKRSKALLLVESKFKQSSDVWTKQYDDTRRELDALNNAFSSAHLKYTQQTHTLEALLPLIEQFEVGSKDLAEWVNNTKIHSEIIFSTEEESRHLLEDLKDLYTVTRHKQYEVDGLEKMATEIDEELLISLNNLKYNSINRESFDKDKQDLKTFEGSLYGMKKDHARLKENLMVKLFDIERNVLMKMLKRDQKWNDDPQREFLEAMTMKELDVLLIESRGALESCEEGLETFDGIEELKNVLHKFIDNDFIRTVVDNLAHNIELVEKIKQLDGIKNQLDNYKIEDKKEYTQQDRVTELKTLINNLQNDINHFYAASFESDEVRNFGASLNNLKIDYEKLQKKNEEIEQKSELNKTRGNEPDKSLDIECMKICKTVNEMEIKIKNISEKLNLENQQNQKFLLDLEETELLVKNRENLLAKSFTSDDSDKFIESLKQMKKEMNRDQKEILNKKLRLSSKSNNFSRVITKKSIDKFHFVFSKVNFFQFILSNKMDAEFQKFGQNHDKMTKMTAQDIKTLEEHLDGLLEVNCMGFNAVALSFFELEQIDGEFKSIQNRIDTFDNNNSSTSTRTFKGNKKGKKVTQNTKINNKPLNSTFQPLLNDIKSKIDLKKEELHDSLKLAVKTEKDIKTLENETNAVHTQAILYKGDYSVAPNVSIDVRTDIIKLLVSRYQDIDSKINNFSRLVFDLISKSPIKQRNVMKLYKKADTTDSENNEEKKNLNSKIEKLKKTSVTLRKFLMDWDNELNDISEMAERFNNIEENILVKLSEVRDKLDSYDEDDVGDFETLEALTFLERDLNDIKKLLTEDAQATFNELRPLQDKSSNLKLSLKIHSLKGNMETLHKDFNILIEKSRNENDKIESLKSKVKRLNSQLDELNELVLEISNSTKPIGALTLEELNTKLKSLKETEKNVDLTNGMYKKMTKQIHEYKKRKESNLFESGKSQEVEFLKNEEQNMKDKWILLTDNLKMSKIMLGELIESLKEASDQYGNLKSWLNKNESELHEKTEMGDVEYISHQIDKTEAILKELEKQQQLIESKMKLIPSEENEGELVARMERVKQMATIKRTELHKALELATKFSADAEELVGLLNEVDVFMAESAVSTESWDGNEICQALETLKTYSMKKLDKEDDFRKCLNNGKEWMEGSGEDTELNKWLKVFEERWLEVPNALENREKELENKLNQIKKVDKQVEDLVGWLDDTEERLVELEEIRVEENFPVVEQLFQDFELLEEEIQGKQELMDRLVEIKASQSLNEEVTQLREKWKRVWLMVMQRRRKLQDVSDRLNEIEHMKNFNAEEWMERWMFSMNDNPSNVITFFRKYDKNNSGMIKREDFVKAIINSDFSTSYLEVEAVADLFDCNDFINYKLFATSLKADEHLREDASESDVISVEIVKQGRRCSCLNKFSIKMVEEGKYRFGDSQKLRLVRTQRNSVMVRVGGGWMSLEEFLLKNDPCRKNRTPELKERYSLAEGTNQAMAAFKSRYPQKPSQLRPQNILEVDKANKTPMTQHHCGSVGSDQEVKQILSSSFRIIDELSSQDSRSNISGESESRTVRRQDTYKF